MVSDRIADEFKSSFREAYAYITKMQGKWYAKKANYTDLMWALRDMNQDKVQRERDADRERLRPILTLNSHTVVDLSFHHARLFSG